MLSRVNQLVGGSSEPQRNPTLLAPPDQTFRNPEHEDPDKKRREHFEVYRRESMLLQEPRERWNPAIKPKSKRFVEMVKIFEDKLDDPDRSIQDILDRYFTKHERDLVIPADKRRNAALARIQRRNRVRCRMLLRSPRFQGWRDAHLGVKLAMLWFGLPVGPIQFDPFDELGSGSDTADDVAEDETEMNRDEAVKKENSLKFLNAYGQRYFGRDHLRKPEPAFEAYYAFNSLYPVAKKKKKSPDAFVTISELEQQDPPVVSLRGGGLSEDLSDMDVDDFNESDIEVESLSDTDNERDGEDLLSGVSLRGGAADAALPEPVASMLKEMGDSLHQPSPAAQQPGARQKRPSARASKTPERLATAKGKEPARDNSPARGDHGQCKTPDVPRSQTATQNDRQREAREAAYAKPPSIHTDNNIPQHAPPVEKILRSGSDNVPSLSVGVLTPTEQRKLQKEHYNMRNQLLDRSQKCPYRGCDRVFTYAEDDRLQEHLQTVHIAERCNFCDEVLYQHWTQKERRAHFLGCHTGLFLNIGQLIDGNSWAAAPRPHGQVDYDRESRYHYCPRCGRSHGILYQKPDRQQHDRVCYPGAPPGEWIGCQECGEFRNRMKRHQCRQVANAEEWPYCEKCGLALGLLKDPYRATHQQFCNTVIRTNPVRRCPWCQLDLTAETYGPKVDDPLQHIQNCNARTAGADGPLDPKTGEPWPPLPPIEEAKGEPDREPPELCTICDQVIIQYDAHMLLKHIETEHPDYTASCIFCNLDYGKHGWAGDRQDILLHMDDHIHARKARLAGDLAKTLPLPAGHPYRRKVIQANMYEDIKARRDAEEWKDKYEALWPRVKRLEAERKEEKSQIDALKKEFARKEKELEEYKRGVHKTVNTPAPGSLVKPLVNPFAPSPPRPSASAPARTPATEQQKENIKSKPKPTTAAKAAVQPPSHANPPPTANPSTPPKRKSRHPPAVHDPSYRPTKSSSFSSRSSEYDSDSDSPSRTKRKKPSPPTRDPPRQPEYISIDDDSDDDKLTPPPREDGDLSHEAELSHEEKLRRAAERRRRTMQQDPSYRPSRGEEQEDDDDEVDVVEVAKEAGLEAKRKTKTKGGKARGRKEKRSEYDLSTVAEEEEDVDA